MTVATKCYSHLAQVADTWEEYAELTEQVMDVLDKFAKVYEQGLSRTIQQILTKLKDHDTADMVRLLGEFISWFYQLLQVYLIVFLIKIS